jgi:hypothetical protein
VRQQLPVHLRHPALQARHLAAVPRLARLQLRHHLAQHRLLPGGQLVQLRQLRLQLRLPAQLRVLGRRLPTVLVHLAQVLRLQARQLLHEPRVLLLHRGQLPPLLHRLPLRRLCPPQQHGGLAPGARLQLAQPLQQLLHLRLLPAAQALRLRQLRLQPRRRRLRALHLLRLLRRRPALARDLRRQLRLQRLHLRLQQPVGVRQLGPLPRVPRLQLRQLRRAGLAAGLQPLQPRLELLARLAAPGRRRLAQLRLRLLRAQLGGGRQQLGGVRSLQPVPLRLQVAALPLRLPQLPQQLLQGGLLRRRRPPRGLLRPGRSRGGLLLLAPCALQLLLQRQHLLPVLLLQRCLLLLVQHLLLQRRLPPRVGLRPGGGGAQLGQLLLVLRLQLLLLLQVGCRHGLLPLPGGVLGRPLRRLELRQHLGPRAGLGALQLALRGGRGARVGAERHAGQGSAAAALVRNGRGHGTRALAAAAAAWQAPAGARPPHLQARDLLLQVAHNVLVLVLRGEQLPLVAPQHLLQPPTQLHHGGVPAPQQRRLRKRKRPRAGSFARRLPR